jgi:hypothetical protein
MAKREEGFAETFLQIFERLAGKESDLELVFRDLTLETAGLKMRLSGTIALNLKYHVKEE